MRTTNRRYDIDWLRVISIAMLLVYHVAIAFQPWGVFFGFIRSERTLEVIWPLMAVMNVWRIPLLFFVSGMGVRFAIRRRNWGQLITERSRRILLPLAFGILAIVPLHLLLWQNFYHQELTYSPGLGHLWFLLNIFVYVLVLSPVIFLLKRRENSRFNILLSRIFKSPLILLLITALFVTETLLVNPEIYSLYAGNLHGWLMGFLAFFSGFLCVHTGEGFWNTVRRGKWILLALSFSLYLVRVLWFNLESPLWLAPVETCSWIFAVFGLGSAYLNRPGPVLNYLSQAAYPVYILHMAFLYLGTYALFPLDLNPWISLLLINLFTFAASLGCFELIRRVRILRPLFGLKY